MEKNISWLAQIKKQFDGKEVDLRTYSPLTLAYVGDSVYDVIIRTVAVGQGNKGSRDLHKTVTGYVNAGTQAALIDALCAGGELTEEETAVYRRGRNAKSGTMAKNASVIEYRKATGMEALIGYLYLRDDFARILELVGIGLHKIGKEI